jgi:hypothetical protein
LFEYKYVTRVCALTLFNKKQKIINFHTICAETAAMTALTTNREAFTGGPGDRYDMKRPQANQLWDRENAAFDSHTTHTDAYTEVKGE